MQPLTIKTALQLSRHLPRLEREVLLSHIIGKDRVFLMTHGETLLTSSQVERYQAMLFRAEKHEPIAYIIGEKEFFGLPFLVNHHALIPRPETEILVEQTLQTISNFKFQISKKKPTVAIVDVGTGSGCIIVSLVKQLQDSRFKIHASRFAFFATDISAKALTIAQKNAREHHIEDRIQFKKSDLLSAIKNKLALYDELFIVANLPYLSTKLYHSTEPNVRNHEPKSALISGTDGLTHYRRLMGQLLPLSKQGIRIHFSFEISPEQAKPCKKWLSPKTLPKTLQITPDLAGKARIISGTLI